MCILNKIFLPHKNSWVDDVYDTVRQQKFSAYSETNETNDSMTNEPWY